MKSIKFLIFIVGSVFYYFFLNYCFSLSVRSFGAGFADYSSIFFFVGYLVLFVIPSAFMEKRLAFFSITLVFIAVEICEVIFVDVEDFEYILLLDFLAPFFSYTVALTHVFLRRVAVSIVGSILILLFMMVVIYARFDVIEKSILSRTVCLYDEEEMAFFMAELDVSQFKYEYVENESCVLFRDLRDSDAVEVDEVMSEIHRQRLKSGDQ